METYGLQEVVKDSLYSYVEVYMSSLVRCDIMHQNDSIWPGNQGPILFRTSTHFQHMGFPREL